MFDKIYHIQEIRDDKNGEETVNSLLKKGWTLISACQVGTLETMDLVYVVGATKEVYYSTRPSILEANIESIESML